MELHFQREYQGVRGNFTFCSGAPLKRKFKITLIVLALCLVLGAAGYYFLLDASPPQDADLMPTRLQIPDEENAFYRLELAATELKWPADDAGREHIWDLCEGEAWDEDFARDLLSQNAKTLEHFQRALACPHLQVPEIKSNNDLLPYLKGCFKTLIRLRRPANG